MMAVAVTPEALLGRRIVSVVVDSGEPWDVQLTLGLDDGSVLCASDPSLYSAADWRVIAGLGDDA